MTRTIFSGFAATLLLAAASSAVALSDPIVPPPATTDQAVPAAAPAAPAKPKPKDKLICKTVIPTGSRLGGKTTCKTKDEWAQESWEDGDALFKANPYNPTQH